MPPEIGASAIAARQINISTIVPLAFSRSSFLGEKDIICATINQRGSLHFEPGTELGAPTEFFSAGWQSNAVQTANWFSQISVANNEKDVVEVIKKQFPDIIDLSVQSQSQIPALYATVKHRQKKMPISLISSGINKFISVMTAIRAFSSGAIMIDEIENGIYYGMYPEFWNALHQFAIESKTQLFLSTHSWECLKAASNVIDKFDKDFSLIQIFQKDGYSKAVVVPGDKAAAAIENGIEVRG